MKKDMKYFCMLFLLAGMMLTSCEADIEVNEKDTTTESYRPQIANTRWELSQIMNQNNEWLSPSLHPVLEIPDLSFLSDNRFQMRIGHYRGYEPVRTVTGSYGMSSGYINLCDDEYTGQTISIKILHLDNNVLEGEIILWEDKTDVKCYNIRLVRYNH